MDETCRLRRGEGYGVCADAVVSKCALREKKEEGPRFPGDLPAEFNRAAAAFASGNPPAQTDPSSAPPTVPFPKSRPPE